MYTKNKLLTKPGAPRNYLTMHLMLFLALLLIFGCSENPTQPDTQTDIIALSNAMQSSSASSQNNNYNCYESSGLITVADGGSIQLGWGSHKNSLSFEPGSIDKDVVIDITTCIVKGNPHNNFSVLEFEFGPSGLFFSPPAQIVINAGSLNALKAQGDKGVIRLNYYNPDTGEWELQEEAEIIKGKATFNIDHFSKFGISHRPNSSR